MQIIDYFNQVKEQQNNWRMQIVKGDWRAAEYLVELLEKNQLQEQYGETTRLLLLVEGTKLLAFCTLAEKDEVNASELKPWIGFVYVFPEYRGKRYSERLIHRACELAKQDGYTKIYVSSEECGLYEKYGFTFWKRGQTIWGKETQVFVKEL